MFIKFILKFLILFSTAYYVNAKIQQLSSACYGNVINVDNIPTLAKGAEKSSVDEATIAWMNTVTTYGDTSKEVSELYSDDAVLWGTVSEDIRFTSKDIKSYFEYFANIPGLTVKPGSFKSVVQVFGKRRNIAISSGYYEFIKPDTRGGFSTIPARFTFAYRKQKYSNKWEIINHHSSIVPKQPGILQGVLNKLRFQKFNTLESYQAHLRQRASYCDEVKEYKKNGKW
tara:strand:+ start:358 stop:1041 length:684 start_codon:yes stop_codon:yes gene_type:complete